MKNTTELAKMLRDQADALESKIALPTQPTMDIRQAVDEIRAALGSHAYFNIHAELHCDSDKATLQWKVYSTKASWITSSTLADGVRVLIAAEIGEKHDGTKTMIESLSPLTCCESGSCEPVIAEETGTT